MFYLSRYCLYLYCSLCIVLTLYLSFVNPGIIVYQVPTYNLCSKLSSQFFMLKFLLFLHFLSVALFGNPAHPVQCIISKSYFLARKKSVHFKITRHTTNHNKTKHTKWRPIRQFRFRLILKGSPRLDNSSTHKYPWLPSSSVDCCVTHS